MKKVLFILAAGILLFAGCGSDDSTPTSYSAGDAGDAVEQTANGVSFDMHYVPSGGPFTMGEDVESTTQEVTLTKNFWMGETEVTQGLWKAVWGGWPHTDPETENYGHGDDYPAYYVSWYDAAAFCNLLTMADDSIADNQQVYYSDSVLTTPYTKTNAANGDAVHVDWDKKGYRLPTEAEWEYAGRYIDGTDWNGGNHVSGDTSASYSTSTVIGDYAWYSGNNSGNPGDPTYGSKSVGQKLPNALGLKDMSGNVWEWCYDWWADNYSGGSQSDPVGPDSGTYRVFRGGCCYYNANYLRLGGRSGVAPSDAGSDIGFRLCRTAD